MFTQVVVLSSHNGSKIIYNLKYSPLMKKDSGFSLAPYLVSLYTGICNSPKYGFDGPTWARMGTHSL